MPMSFRASERKNVPIDRRRLVGYLGAASFGLVAAPALIGRALAQAPRWAADPFSLGVASGGPRPDGFVLWTRLAPHPLSGHPAAPGGVAGGGGAGALQIPRGEALAHGPPPRGCRARDG